MKIKSVCVYCGSNVGYKPVYADAARQLAKLLVERDITMVFGGGNVGIMGVMANTMLELGGNVIGITTKLLVKKEVAHQGLKHLEVVDTMHQRKARMADYADAYITLPGGLGSLEELFEMWTWAQLGYHSKLCAILNVEHYYDHLITFLEHAVAEGFIKKKHHHMAIIENEPCLLLDRIFAYEQTIEPTIDNGMGREDI